MSRRRVRLDRMRARPDHRRRPGVDRLSGQSLLGPPSLRLRHEGERPRSSPSGTGPPGFLRALRCRPRDRVGSETKERCFLHEVAHILSALPRSIRPQETRTSAQVRDAEDRDHALAAATAFEVDRPTWPKVADTLRSDLDRLRASPRTRPPLGSRDDVDVDRVERLDVASPDQGEEGASVEIGRPRPHRHTPSRRPRACGCDVPKRGWRLSRTESLTGRCRSGWPGRSRSFGGSSVWRSTSATRTRPDSALPTGT